MKKIASFTIDHIKLLPGLYVSRKDHIGSETITTFDIRMTKPNAEPVMNTAEMHTIEQKGNARRTEGAGSSDAGDVCLYPRFPRGSTGRQRKGLRELSRYESADGKLSGREISARGADGYYAEAACLS